MLLEKVGTAKHAAIAGDLHLARYGDEAPPDVAGWLTLSSVLTPTGGVDPRSALATSMHAAPEVYAVLLGSGMSKAAGIPTSWQVLRDLIRKVAAAEGLDPDGLGGKPEDWWRAVRHADPKYDTLLSALAPTDELRRAVLRGYFEPSMASGTPPVGAAHEALARLCANGRVRLILTTNFDRLIERALEHAGVAAQVLSDAGAIKGMTPLTQAGVTVVKLHGDYASSPLRNTPKELGTYPPILNRLLDQVFDEFGLVVLGWSAEYDKALVSALLRARSRRYPMYWCVYKGDLGEAARRVVDHRRATRIEIGGAEEFFPDLHERLLRLDRISARRRGRSVLRYHRFTQDLSTPPPGWTAQPLLYLRAAAAYGPAPLDECDFIRPEQRERLVLGLSAAPATSTIAALEPFVTHKGQGTGKTWSLAPGAANDLGQARYRLGSDGTTGVSALATVEMPHTFVGDLVTFQLNVGISFTVPLPLELLAKLLTQLLVLTSSTMPTDVADIMPAGAGLTIVEFHLAAPQTDGRSNSRPNDLRQRVDLGALGTPPSSSMVQGGYAAEVPEPMSMRQASEFVVEGIEYIALAHGFLDPRGGIAQMRRFFQLPLNP